jgi:molecular chaperone GrpE
MKKKESKEHEIQVLKLRIKELEEGWRRTQADFENFSKREENLRGQVLELSKAEFMSKITPVLDNFRRAFEHISEKDNTAVIQGLKQIEKQLEDILASEGLKRIETAGQKFDANLHEAISCEPNQKIPTDEIIAEIESGWMFNDKIIKCAKVRVSKGK